MRLTVLTMPAALLLLLCIACHSSNEKEVVSGLNRSASADTTGVIVNNEDVPSPKKEEKEAPAGNGGPSWQVSSPLPATNPDWDKKIIRTADLSVEVKSFLLFGDRLRKAVKQEGGYISQEQQGQSTYSIENMITIKVPVDRFDDLLKEVPSDSDKLVEKKISTEDVTMEVVDTKSRLESKKEIRERYLELLKQAHSMKDILAIQEEIDEIQENMESASGRIAYLSHSAAYSTINLKFYQVLDPAVRESPSLSFFDKIRISIREGWNWGSAFLIGLISIWPLWILAGLGWWMIRGRIRKFPKLKNQ